jgi:outer membrane cobalamin receptor
MKRMMTLLMLTICIVCQISNAEENTSYEVYELSEVVVSAQKPVSESSGTVYRITDQDIKIMGANNLEEALQLVPGITIRTGNAGTPRVDIRGFRTRHVQLLLNGVPMNDTYDGQFDPTAIPIEFVSEIKVISGAASVLYGSGGNGGVINIITRKGREGIHTYFSGEMFEYEGFLGKTFISVAKERFHAFISGGMYDREAFPLSDDFHATKDQSEEYRYNSDRRRKNVFANFGYDLSDQTSIGMTLHHTNGENGVPPITNFSKDDPFTKKIKYDRLDRMEGNLTQISFKHQKPEGFYFKGTAFVNQLDSLTNRYDDETYSEQLIKKSQQNNIETLISGFHAFMGKDMKQKGHLEMAFFSHDEQWETFGFEIINNKGGKEDIHEKEDIQNFGIAASYNLVIQDKIRIVTEYAHHFSKGASDENDFCYLLGMNMDILPQTTLKVSHAKKVRFPSLKQLYHINDGNSALTPENTFHYEIGLIQKLPLFTQLHLTGFYIEADDYIEKDADERYENNDQYLFQGMEMSMDSHFLKELYLKFSYTWLDSEDQTEGSEKDELQHRPTHKVTCQANYSFPFGLKVYFDFLHVGRQFYYDSDNKAPLEKKQLNDYSIVNMKLTQKLSDENISVYLGADNLLDEDYEQSYGLPRPGRSIFGGFEWQW